jgi:hypothetical protein
VKAPRYVQVAFDVLRVDLPLEEVRHSRKVWNHVEELRVEPALSVRLVRNGIRIGTTSAASWPAIAAILDAGQGKSRRDRIICEPGAPLTIALGVIQEDQPIFRFDLSNRLTGKTYSAGEKLLVIEYALRPEWGRSIDLRVSLEIRHDPGTLTWERRGEILVQVPALERHVFSDLTAVVTLQPAEILVLGPSEKADQTHLPGGAFFGGEASGNARFETLFFITPEPYAMPNPLAGSS